MKKYGYKDDFEMLCLRHEYITRIDLIDEKWIDEFAPIVHSTSRIMFEKLRPNFEKVGFDLEDIISITNVYMVSYMSIYSIFRKKNKEKKDVFIQKYIDKYGKTPNKEIIYRKDKNNLISFLRQRLHHCSTICSRKARNIVADKDVNGFFAETENTIKTSPDVIIKEYKKYNYRKITRKEFLEAKKIAKDNNSKQLYDKNGFIIIEVEIFSKPISQKDYRIIFDGNRGAYHNSPESTLINRLEDVELESFKNRFNNLDKKQRRNVLKNFINNNKDLKNVSKEVSLARKMLKNIKTMV